MDVELNDGNRIFFYWAGNGELRVDLVKPPAADARWDDPAQHWPIAASTTLTGNELVSFLEMFITPLMRRALTVAVKYPSK